MGHPEPPGDFKFDINVGKKYSAHRLYPSQFLSDGFAHGLCSFLLAEKAV